MKKITFLLLLLGLLLSLSTRAQIPTVLTEANFSTKTGTIIDPRDGKTYAYKTYGKTEWFMQNLNWDGYDGKNDATKGTVGAWGSADTDGSKYGRFYPQSAAKSVCPKGWISSTRNDLSELTKDVSSEYNLPDLKDLTGNKYVFQNMLKYMRGGKLKENAADGLWDSGTGELDIEASNKTQFNILPMGEFNGTDYAPNFGVGKAAWFLVGSTSERFRTQHATKEYSSLKHYEIKGGVVYGAVRCMRHIINEAEFDLIMSRIQADYEGRRTAEGNDANVKAHLAFYQDTIDVITGKNIHGNFTDIPYTSKQRASWPVVAHLSRIQNMAFAYTMPGSEFYENEVFYDKIQRCLQLWYDRNLTNENWYPREIGAPKPLGIALIQLRKGKKQLPADLEENLIWRTLSREAWTGDWQSFAERQAGPNKTNIALVYLYRAVLNKDASLMKRAMDQAFYPIKLVTSEGIQHDYSYFQHGQQFQLGAYGQDLIGTTTDFMNYVVGTDYTMSGDRLKIYSKYLRESYYRIIRGKNIQFNAIGRAISRVGGVSRSGTGYAVTMRKGDPEHADEYTDIIDRIKGDKPVGYNVKPNNTTFFVGDYMMHNRPKYQIAMRTASTRTVRSEWGNSEAMQTYFMSDGSTCLLQKGDEYHNLAVGWNWTRIPGTTAPQFEFSKIPKTPNGMYTAGLSTYTGGVSDSLYSANTYVHNDTYAKINTKYNKSWFFFDDEVVCLGSDITSTSTLEVNTTVEQNLLNTDIIVSTDSGEETLTMANKGEFVYDNNMKWALHNGAGYVFPNGGKLKIENTTTTRSWKELNASQSANQVATEVFSLWFDHGLKPTNDSYAYIIVPGMNTAEEMNSYDASNIEILANTDSVQVVKHKGLNIWQVVFLKAATFESEELTIKAENAISLILKNVGTPNVTMHAADPGQNQEVIKIGTLIPSMSPEMKQTICDFTGTARYAGATKVYTINESLEIFVPSPPPVVEPEVEPDFVYESISLADTYVLNGTSAATNFGTDKTFLVRKDLTGRNREAYLKFSTADLDKISNLDEYNLKISIALYPTATRGSVTSIKWLFLPVTDITWNEAEVTWNKKPAVATPSVIEVKGLDLNSEEDTIYSSEKVLSVDISDYVLEAYKNEKEAISLCIRNDKQIGGSTDLQVTYFASKEHANELMRPRLIVKAYKKKTAQTIDLGIIPSTISTDDYGFDLEATSSSGLPITYTSSNENVITIEDVSARSTATTYFARVVGPGTTVITATQAGDADYAAVTSTQEVTVTDGTGIGENENVTSLKVYPNPVLAGQAIYVSAEGLSANFLASASIKVYSSIGVELTTVKVRDAITPITIPTSGVYIIKVVSDGYKKEFKVIVK